MNIYGKLSSIFFLIVGAILISAGVSHPFRCGTRLVSDGDTKAQVIHKCGEPDVVDSWEEERIYRDFRFERENDPRTGDYRRNRSPFLVKENVKIDVWTYNLGVTRFIRYLTFENGVLTEIKTGDKGY